MLTKVAIGLTTLFISGSSLGYAQQAAAPAPQTQQRFSASDWNALTAARIAVVKATLQLKPDQTQYWPAIEEAIRNRATTREQRMVALRATLGEQDEFQPIEFMRARADALGQKAESLRKLADAWQPLYATLDQDQKRRMRLLAVHVLRELSGAAESRERREETEED
ncbi:MAG: Spy/CpxP family protein refolding chaperone [Methylocella sp.]